MIVEQTPLFAKQKKKLHANQIQSLDAAIRTIIENPMIGEKKRGDLDFVHVLKFRMVAQECLLAYQWISPNKIILLAVGVYGNIGSLTKSVDGRYAGGIT